MKSLNLTIICVSYNSNERLEKLITNLNKNFKIVIVENSNNKKLKQKLIKYNKNIKFYFPKKNNGFGAGLNYGLKKIKTKYTLYLDLDTKITSRQVKQIYNRAKLTNNFGVITVKIKGQNYKNLILGNDLENRMKFLNFNTGCVMMFENKNFDKIGYFDERFFLYFEESDFYERCKKLNKKIYLYEKVTIEHLGGSSIDARLIEKYKQLRNWHYCWSKYNFYLKHKGILIAISKTFPNLKNSIKGILYNILFFNKRNLNLSLSELSGLMSGYLNLKSYFRIH